MTHDNTTLISRPRYTAPDWALELVALAGLLAIYVVLIAHWSALPDRIPMKFSLSGQVTSTGPKAAAIVLPLVLTWVYFILTVVDFLPMGMRNHFGPRTPENWARQAVLTRRLLLSLKLVVAWTMAAGMLDTCRVAIHGGTGSAWIAPALLTALPVLIAGYLYFAWRSAQLAHAEADRLSP